MAQHNIYAKNGRTVIQKVGESKKSIVRVSIEMDTVNNSVFLQDLDIKNQSWTVNYGEILDESGAQIDVTGTQEDVVTDYLTSVTAFRSGSGGSDPVDPINYKADNYTGILAVATDPQLNELAYARDSEGTSWLPWTLGGTYYPAGLYWYNGSEWVSDREAIAEQLSINVEDIAVVEASLSSVNTTLNSHILNINNPHNTTLSDLGLVFLSGDFTMTFGQGFGVLSSANGINWNHGKYVKIGNMVNCQIGFKFTGVSGVIDSKGAFRLDGLPFPPSNLYNNIDGAGVSGLFYQSVSNYYDSLVQGGVDQGSTIWAFVFYTGIREANKNSEVILNITYITDY